MTKSEKREIVLVNQAVNYLTIGLCNAFSERFQEVALITGSIHVQGEELQESVKVAWINKWVERPAKKKLMAYLVGTLRIYWLLLTRFRRYEVFFVSLPPMGYLLTLFLPQKCSMLIWDIYPDIFKITGMTESHGLYRTWGYLNRKVFAKAHRVFTISERMADLLGQYMSRKKILTQPIWAIFQENNKAPKDDNPFVKSHGLEGKFVVQYSGNIGLTHKVEVLVELAEKMQIHSHILFQIIGRGPRKPLLEQMVQDKNLPNCQFLPFQSDEMFPYSLSAADLGVVILDALTSKGSVPSKSYNLMSYGIPSLYIATPDSQLQVYADQYGHALCFAEEQLSQAAAAILELSHSPQKQLQYAQSATQASQDFRRGNADKFVEKYIG